MSKSKSSSHSSRTKAATVKVGNHLEIEFDDVEAEMLQKIVEWYAKLSEICGDEPPAHPLRVLLHSACLTHMRAASLERLCQAHGINTLPNYEAVFGASKSGLEVLH